jgi:hypothetical protein
MRPRLLPIITSLCLAAALPSRAVEINVPDHSFAPDGSTTSAYQQTDIATPNGGNVLPTGASSHVAYFVTTFTFGENSDAHLQANFRATGGQARVGVEVNDDGLVQFIGTGDTTRTTFNLSQNMAGRSVVLLVKAHYDPNHNVIYGKSNAADDTLFNAWVNPTGSSVEGSGQSAGDMQTVWNSATFGFFGQTIQNQSTLGTAGTSLITDTVVLTGADATFANALALATGGPPPPGHRGRRHLDRFLIAAGRSCGRHTTSTITVTLKDGGGSPVAGKEVSLSGNGSATIETGNNTSDANGVVTFTVKSITPGGTIHRHGCDRRQSGHHGRPPAWTSRNPSCSARWMRATPPWWLPRPAWPQTASPPPPSPSPCGTTTDLLIAGEGVTWPEVRWAPPSSPPALRRPMRMARRHSPSAPPRSARWCSPPPPSLTT